MHNGPSGAGIVPLIPGIVTPVWMEQVVADDVESGV